MAENAEISKENLKEEDEAMEASSDDSSSDDDSDEAETKEQQRMEQMSEFEAQITANPYIYDPHVSLIKALRQAGELQLLRRARERMSDIFPLTEELWLDWLQDEEKIASSETEREAICSLFERAGRDYLSVDIWLEYAQFSIGRMSLKDGARNVRSIFERAITACGLHVSRGSMIWDAFREFENIMVAAIQPTAEALLTDSQLEELTEQKNRVANLFKRQLTIPLMDMDKTFQEYKDWAEEPSLQVEQGFKKAWTKLQKIQPFEEALLVADPPRRAEYQAYLEFEMNEGDPTRIQCLFERALVDNCLQPEMWQNYAKYLETQLKISTVSLPVLERAVRNCPWSVTLWQIHIQAMERYNQPHEKVKELIDRALGAGFTRADEFRQLWITFLDYLRRRIDWKADHEQNLQELRNTFLRAHNHLVECFEENADPLGTILQYWARIEARYCNNMVKARELWSEIMALGNGMSSQMWLEYLNLERSCGDVKQLRKMFQKALQSTVDWPEVIGDAWLNFEREEGTLETWEAATVKYEARLLTVQEKRAKTAQQEHERESRDKHRKDERRSSRHEKRQNNRQQGKEQNRSEKRKFQADRSASSSGQNDRKRPMSVDGDGFKIPSTPSGGKWENLTDSKAAENDDGPLSKKMKTEASDADAKTVFHDSSKDDYTIFLSNLAYTVNEDDIKQAFSTVGEIKELRLVRNYKGQSKGYCYVQFSSKEEAKEALKKDRELMNGRPMFVSPCEDRKQGQQMPQPKFRYQTGLEKCKLFVKGLPFSTTKEQLVDMYKAFGELKDVRLVTYRNGRSKGIAFVDFKEESAASLALIKTDGTKIEEHTISVALSNPPERKGPQGLDARLPQNIASLGGGAKEVGLRGRGRTQVSLVPRSVRKTQPPPATVSSAKQSDVNSVNGSENGSVKPDAKPMSNDDFRNMLLNK